MSILFSLIVKPAARLCPPPLVIIPKSIALLMYKPIFDMNKLFLYFLLFPLVILSQSNIYSGGVEFSDEYGSAYKVGYERLFYEKLKKSYSIGFEFGQSFAALSGDNMTGYIGFNEYPEDFTGDYKKNSFNSFSQVWL